MRQYLCAPLAAAAALCVSSCGGDEQAVPAAGVVPLAAGTARCGRSSDRSGALCRDGAHACERTLNAQQRRLELQGGAPVGC